MEFNATPWLGVVGDLGGYAVARNGSRLRTGFRICSDLV